MLRRIDLRKDTWGKEYIERSNPIINLKFSLIGTFATRYRVNLILKCRFTDDSQG